MEQQRGIGGGSFVHESSADQLGDRGVEIGNLLVLDVSPPEVRPDPRREPHVQAPRRERQRREVGGQGTLTLAQQIAVAGGDGVEDAREAVDVVGQRPRPIRSTSSRLKRAGSGSSVPSASSA